MIINKIYDVKLNIDNINIIFSKDINGVILDLITNKFKNRCYLETYILNINKVLNRSLIETDKSDLNGLLFVCVQFEAECIVYSKDEVILEMTIKNIINNSISLTNEFCNGIIKMNKNVLEFNKGQIIPIKVGKAKFDPGSDKIEVNAYPFIPLIDNIVYYKLNTISDKVKEKLHDIIDMINNEEEEKKNILKDKTNKWTYFDDLVYPYKKNITNDKLKKDKYEDILNIDNLQNSIISYDSEVSLSKRLIKIDKTTDEYLECDSFEILYNIYKKYYLHIQLINNLSKLYNNDNDIAKNKNIFDLYNKYKK